MNVWIVFNAMIGALLNVVDHHLEYLAELVHSRGQGGRADLVSRRRRRDSSMLLLLRRLHLDVVLSSRAYGGSHDAQCPLETQELGLALGRKGDLGQLGRLQLDHAHQARVLILIAPLEKVVVLKIVFLYYSMILYF